MAELGKLLEPEANSLRDAVHIAIAPMVSGEELWPGSPFKLVYGTIDMALRADDISYAVGVVDPFLSDCVPKGGRFFGLLKPGTITGLRHEWSHPAFDVEVAAQAGEHELWLRQFCDRWRFGYEELLAAGLGTENDRYVVAQGIDLHGPGDFDSGELTDFWYHLEALSGKQFSESHREGVTWTCSC